MTDDSQELPSLTFKEHCETLKDAGEAARSIFPDNEANAARIADALIGAGYAMKAIPKLEERLAKLETGVEETVKLVKGLRNETYNEKSLHNSLKTNNGKTVTVTDLKNEIGPNPFENRLNRIESEIARIGAALERLLDGMEPENHPATLEEISAARKMAEKLSADISARNRKKEA